VVRALAAQGQKHLFVNWPPPGQPCAPAYTAPHRTPHHTIADLVGCL
jgi:hypothetical protein